MTYLINTENNRLYAFSENLAKRGDMRAATDEEIDKGLGKPVAVEVDAVSKAGTKPAAKPAAKK